MVWTLQVIEHVLWPQQTNASVDMQEFCAMNARHYTAVTQQILSTALRHATTLVSYWVIDPPLCRSQTSICWSQVLSYLPLRPASVAHKPEHLLVSYWITYPQPYITNMLYANLLAAVVFVISSFLSRTDYVDDCRPNRCGSACLDRYGSYICRCKNRTYDCTIGKSTLIF